MSLLIKDYEGNELINQIKYVVASNVSEEYPHYFCTISNATYDNYECCFYEELIFYGNSFRSTLKNYRIAFSSSGSYRFTTDYSSCNTKVYSKVNQDLDFTNVANSSSGLINLISDINYSTSTVNSSGESVPLDFTTLIPYFIAIIAVLMLIFIRDFIKSCFRRRV